MSDSKSRAQSFRVTVRDLRSGCLLPFLLTKSILPERPSIYAEEETCLKQEFQGATPLGSATFSPLYLMTSMRCSLIFHVVTPWLLSALFALEIPGSPGFLDSLGQGCLLWRSWMDVVGWRVSQGFLAVYHQVPRLPRAWSLIIYIDCPTF